VEAEEIAETKLHRIQGSALRWSFSYGERVRALTALIGWEASKQERPPCPVSVALGEVPHRALGLSVAQEGRHCAGPFLLWCSHRWVREGEAMNIKSLLAALVLEFFDERLCFAKRTG